jgi:hypothetical protein
MSKEIKFWREDIHFNTISSYPVRNDLKKLIERLPEDEEFVGIVYDGSFTLEVLTGRKYKKDD